MFAKSWGRAVEQHGGSQHLPEESRGGKSKIKNPKKTYLLTLMTVQTNKENGKTIKKNGGAEPIQTKKRLPSEDGGNHLDRGGRRSRHLRPLNRRRVAPVGKSRRGLNLQPHQIGLSHIKRTPGASAARPGKGVASEGHARVLA